MALTGAAVGAFTSTLAPVNFPEDNNPNPFATENTGQGCVNAIITFTGVLAGLVMAGPILAGLAFSRTSVPCGTGLSSPWPRSMVSACTSCSPELAAKER